MAATHLDPQNPRCTTRHLPMRMSLSSTCPRHLLITPSLSTHALPHPSAPIPTPQTRPHQEQLVHRLPGMELRMPPMFLMSVAHHAGQTSLPMATGGTLPLLPRLPLHHRRPHTCSRSSFLLSTCLSEVPTGGTSQQTPNASSRRAPTATVAPSHRDIGKEPHHRADRACLQVQAWCMLYLTGMFQQPLLHSLAERLLVQGEGHGNVTLAPSSNHRRYLASARGPAHVEQVLPRRHGPPKFAGYFAPTRNMYTSTKARTVSHRLPLRAPQG